MDEAREPHGRLHRARRGIQIGRAEFEGITNLFHDVTVLR